jgi:serine/threonine protein kinase
MKKSFLFLIFFEVLILFSNSPVKGIINSIDKILKKTNISKFLINIDEKYSDFDWNLIQKDENFIDEGCYKKVYKYSFEGVDRAFVFFSKSKDEFLFKKNLSFHCMHKNENIINAFAYSNEKKCIVFEYADYDLFDYLGKKELTLSQKIKLFRSICLGVKYLHDNFIVHGDLKPENILVFGDGDELSARLIDFDFSFSPSKRKLQVLSGSICYMHPAAFKDRFISLSREIYSLGMTLYMILLYEDVSSFIFNLLDKKIPSDQDYNLELFSSIVKIYDSGGFKKGLEYYIGNLYFSYLLDELDHGFDGISLKYFNFLRELILYCLFDENVNIDGVIERIDKIEINEV